MSQQAAVFISHGSGDRDAVTDVVDVLEGCGVKAFYAPHSIYAGEGWQTRLREEVELCDEMLVYWTPCAAESKWVWIEIGMAAAFNRKVVPFCPTDDFHLHRSLDGVQSIRSFNGLARWASRLAQKASPNKPPNLSNSYIAEQLWENLYHFPGGYVWAVRLYGAGSSLIPASRMRILYDPRHFEPDLQTFPWYTSETESRRALTANNFFNGPNARLLTYTVTPAPAHAATEIDTLTVHLGPVGWFHYAGINEYLRDRRDNFHDQDVARWIDLPALRDDFDVKRSLVPNILDTCTTIITLDERVAFQERMFSGVDARPRNLTSSVAENINRFKDDADGTNHRLLHAKNYVTSGRNLQGNSYQPEGVPHPFAAVRRGITDELAPAVLDVIEEGPFPEIQCTGLSYDLDSLHPDALFVACFPGSSMELIEIVRGNEGERGKEWREGRLRFMSADFRKSDATRILSGPRAWNPGGHASVVRAIELLSAVRRERSCGHPEAMRAIGTTE
jgi:hypothetical protein